MLFVSFGNSKSGSQSFPTPPDPTPPTPPHSMAAVQNVTWLLSLLGDLLEHYAIRGCQNSERQHHLYRTPSHHPNITRGFTCHDLFRDSIQEVSYILRDELGLVNSLIPRVGSDRTTLTASPPPPTPLLPPPQCKVTGLLSLLEDLSEDDHAALALPQGRGHRLRRARQHLTLNSGVLADGRGGVSVEGEGGGERRLLIVAGDFNFNSTSAGYRRLVEDGGLQSAVGASLLSANCSGSSRCRSSGGGGDVVGGAIRRGVGIGIGGGPGGGSSSATSNSGVSSSRSGSYSSNSGDSFGTPVPFGIVGEGKGMERVLTLPEAVAMGEEKNDAEREEYDGGFGDGGDGDGHGDDHGDDDGGGDGDGIGDDGEKIDSDGDGDDGGVAVGGHVHLVGADVDVDGDGDVDVDGDVDGGGGVDIDSVDDGDEDGDRDDDSVGEEAPLDFVFFSLGPGAYLEAYEVHREFSQERYADGYPSVTDFGVRCPLLPS